AMLCVFITHATNLPLWMGLDIFFVLSGFLITQILLSLKKNPAEGYWRSFYLRRAIRVLPPYVLFLLIAVFAWKMPFAKTWYWYLFLSANVGSALHEIGRGPWAPLWSLALEEQFYLIWPWFVLFCSVRVLQRLLIGLMISAPLLRMLVMPYMADTYAIAHV